jgi:hypothetical protein
MQLGGSADLLRPSVWSREYGLMKFRYDSDKGTASKFVQISKKREENPGND